MVIGNGKLSNAQNSFFADSLLLQIHDVPDSALAFSPLTFRVKYNTTARDLCLNVGVNSYPVEDMARTFSNWVNGIGERTYNFRVPNYNRANGFYVFAYLTNNGMWNGKEFFVWTYDSRSKVLPADLNFSWSFDVSQSVAVETPFYTTVHYALSDLRPRNIPNLVVDLVAKDQRVVARQIEWSVPESASYRHKWILPKNVNTSSLKLVARIEEERFDKNRTPLASKDGPEFSLSGSTAQNFNSVAFHTDSLFIDGRSTFFHGVDIFSFWYSWSDSIARREVGKMHDAGFNFARVYLDWSLYQPRMSESSESQKRKITTFLRAADSLNIWIELVPVGNWGSWVYDLYRDHWWTNPISQNANTQYFEEVGRFLDSINVKNIYYVSMMQEGSWNFDWYDPLNGEFPKPGTGAIAEADADWRSWLKDRGLPYQSFDDTNPELFGRWCAERFADLLYLRASAFRRGSKYKFAVGAEGAGSGNQYDRRLLGKHTAYYSIPEMWAHVVDCLEVHTYRAIEGDGYWSGSTGLKTYREWTSDFRKPVHVGEVNWNYVDTMRLNMNADTTWRRLKEKLELIRSLGYTGYGVWAWMDYDSRRLGFLDRQYQPRPILDSISKWIRATQTLVQRERPVSSFTLAQNYPNPFSGMTNVDLRVSNEASENISLKMYDVFGREVKTLFEGELDEGEHTISFNNDGLRSGQYFIRMSSGNISRVIKTVLLK